MLADDVVHDVRYASRMLRRSPALTAAVVLSLALGIGANTAIFSVVDVLMLRSLPVRAPERLVRLTTSGGAYISYARFERFRDEANVADLSAIIHSDRYNVSIAGPGTPRGFGGRLRLASCSWSLRWQCLSCC